MNRQEPHGSCERTGDAAPYVLGALDDADDFRSHLANCAACRAEVAEMVQIADALPDAAPRLRAPAVVSERILAVVRSEAELLRAAGASSDLPHRSPRAVLGRRAIAISAALAAAAAAFALAFAIRTPPSSRVSHGSVSSALAGARISLRRAGDSAELSVTHFPQAPVGRVYEVWLRRVAGPPQPTDALFGVTVQGRGAVAVPGSLNGVREILVTSEPAGGSVRPTSAPLARVVLAA
jgi:hypothetical protein